MKYSTIKKSMRSLLAMKRNANSSHNGMKNGIKKKAKNRFLMISVLMTLRLTENESTTDSCNTGKLLNGSDTDLRKPKSMLN